MIDWSSYNRSSVQRGEILFSYDILDTWGSELEKMNECKKGKPFVFPNSFILAIGYIRYFFHLPYRQTEGIIKVTGKGLHANPHSYGHICKRINKLNIEIKGDKTVVDDDNKYIIIAVDSTGIKVTNRGQWMDKKWDTQNRKGYLKIHAAVNGKTKEKVHDGRILKKLVNHVLDDSKNKNKKIRNKNRNGKKIKSVLADRAHDTNRNLGYLEQRGILPGIKVRKNSIISIRNNRLRNKEVLQQTKEDLLKWKKKRKYGHRWMTETDFSTIKRMFGEYVSATKFDNMVKEMMITVSLYNLFRRI
ncbi:MAG: IS5 family transposase [Candidatus Nitrosocosmicus sp.]|nr:IS5 family transposase [Candidatus Nitrosocosmicus sp.]MDN5867913.1 IS5 family transposase [Candidatus Nitrosocosmicus sp.]